jgi:hypothetical protein
VRAQVTIGSEDLKANHMIQQVFQFPSELDKYRSLVKLLEQEMDGSRLLVRTSPFIRLAVCSHVTYADRRMQVSASWWCETDDSLPC